MDANFVQTRMDEIQQNDEIADAFAKIVSGKSGYKTVIEKKPIVVLCRGCNKKLDQAIKFCPECGTKVWIKPTKCPKCIKSVSNDDKFCQNCGENLEPPK